MTQTISEHAGNLVVLRCWCGVQHAVPESLRKIQLRKKERGENMFIWCPLGHQHTPAGDTAAQAEAKRLARELETKERALASKRRREVELEGQLETERHRTRAQKAAKTRLKNRVAKGVCPCCNRHFANLQRHIETQHPGYEHAD